MVQNGKKITAFAGRFITVFAFILAISLALSAFWLFSIERFDPISNKWFDGLGRELHPGPGAHGVEYYPGLLWQIVDTVVGILLFGICAGLFKLGRSLKKSASE